MKATLAGSIIMSVLLIAGGCCAQAHPEPLTVYLRDAETKAPIVGATVEVRPRIGINPAVPARCRVSDQGQTQEDGSVQLIVSRGWQVDVYVYSVDYPEARAHLPHPADAGNLEWFDATVVRRLGTPAPIELRATRGYGSEAKPQAEIEE